ncbi:DNA repair protein rad16 [Friedmanniomyces endolithicus]|uniref:DNA repair protein rad16 n=1 Tax=Friedmanniomyces endolithicus TaxID=329885 RepID=A0AAN6G2U1_9PEZI|nr:DNA repair protein rad16 [Friedmanniomyces endolithicus]KAK0291381.1 DNA repair protein rad16 [Friedmanniomyces endolithicus]KAK0328783.1 DNA repair protein rad16 [Friedmanniomyces endolithicus]KAK1019522.1 DNA repair protein rad16 [Friedmanniomyces endolithicus]
MARPSPKKMAESTSPTDTSLSSLGSTPRADSAGYETPGTTPATSIRGPATNKRKRSQLNTSVLQIEDSDEAMEDADLAMARRLQEEEYAHEEPQEEIAAKKRQKFGGGKVQDSEEEISELSELSESESVQLADSEGELSEVESELSVDSEPLIKRVKKSAGLQHELEMKHRGKPVHKPAPGPSKGKGKQEAAPVRAAHAIARKSIGQTLKTKVEDSESELDSEEDFQVTESEAVSTGVSDNELDGQDVPPAAPAAAKNRRRAGGRGRNDRRFGNYTEEDAVNIAGELEEMMLTRKDRERKKLEKSHPGIKTMWEELGDIPIIKPVPAQQPESISRKLKVFQLEGLDWMMRQEKSHYKGGLLGDEMGMGKTIQAVSLIMSDFPQKIPTLVIVPPVALMQWSAEINQYTDGKLNVLVYHGQNSKIKGMSVKALKKFDVIMISYNSLESLHRKETKGWSRGENIIKEASPIHAIHFHRLILDEAHSIKSRTTGVAKACFALKGTYKWCLSGTPVQNRIGEFFSLLRFLEVRPFADYFCKRCPCSILHWKLDDDHMCASCKHSGMEHVSVFNQELLNPLTQSEEATDRTEAMDKLHMITARIMLRRMKRDYTSSMELPPKEVIVHNEFFGEIERDFSSSIMSNTARQFDTYVAKGVMLNNYANIFGLIMQMRQVANHPDLLLKRHAQQGQNVLVCNICDEVAEEAIRSQCKHDFCRSCVKSYLQSVEETGGDADCPRCHIALAIDLDQPDIEQDEDVVKKSSIINRIKMENWTSSTKIEMLVYDLYKLRSKKQTLKSIVFSQFTSMLQLIEWRLRRAGFNTVMLDGSMTPIQRQRSIEYFMNNSDVEVFLVSLKAGGVALNLTEASRVFIVDPWWNPAAEWQSADRCHRIGQRRPCVITRLCIEDSVESRMVMLQEKKANMINGTINNDKTSMEKLTPEDMQFLFRGT